MIFTGDEDKNIYLVALLVLVSRIPFLFAGFGSEEDAWGLILVARNISITGIYEVSRLPGHPVQEILLSFLWSLQPWVLNLLTALVSSAGVLFFMLTLKHLKIQHAVTAGLIFAFAPVYYINSTNVMDYTWAISMVIFSFYMLVRGNLISSAIILGIACGFRITAGAMLIPFIILLWQEDDKIKKIISYASITLLVSLVCYLPAYHVYGKTFFTYYEYFPYPPLLKNIYKGTIGAWGVPGFLAVVIGFIISVITIVKSLNKISIKNKFLLLASGITVLLYMYSFLRIPQKTAFIIPMIPFIILIFAITLSAKQLKLIAITMIVSCFFAGINLDDPIRGSESSRFAVKTIIGSTPISIDLFSGPVLADYSKRKLKIKYASELVSRLSQPDHKKIIIAGWWQNELKYFSLKQPNPLVSFLYYADVNALNDSIENGAKVYYLPEQDYYNDLRYKQEFTKALASPLN